MLGLLNVAVGTANWDSLQMIWIPGSFDVPDDVLYQILLYISFVLAFPIPFIQEGVLRSFYCTIIGFLTSMFMCGIWEIHHVFICILGTFLICKFLCSTRWIGVIVLLFSFCYVGIIRTLIFFYNWSWRGPTSICVNLINLKLVSFAFHVQDQYLARNNYKNTSSSSSSCSSSSSSISSSSSSSLSSSSSSSSSFSSSSSSLADSPSAKDVHHELQGENNTLSSSSSSCHEDDDFKFGVVPSFSEYIHYIFFFPGMWSGPFMSYELIHRALQHPDTNKMRMFPTIRRMLLVALPHCLLYYIIPVAKITDAIFSPAFPSWSFPLRVSTIFVVIFHRRARFLGAWMMSALTCLVSGVAYDSSPAGGEDKINFKAIKPYDIAGVEFGTSLKIIGRSWNCSVQWWMATYIYKRVKTPNIFFRKLCVMFVTSFWHGLEMGYYAMFFLYTIFQTSQEEVWKMLPPSNELGVIRRYLLITGQWMISQLLLFFVTTPFVFTSFTDFFYLWRMGNFYGVYIFLGLWSIIFLERLMNLKSFRGKE